MVTNMKNEVDIVILTAVPEEAEPFEKYMTKCQTKKINHIPYIISECFNTSVALVICGVGATNAAIVTSQMIFELSPNYLFFSGNSGAIDNSLNIGDVIIAERIYGEEGLSPQRQHNQWPCPINNQYLPAAFTTDKTLLNNAIETASQFSFKVRVGNVVSTDYFPFPPGFTDLYQQYSADVIDMESAAFAQTCWLYEKPFMVIRGVSNPVDEQKVVEFDVNELNLSADNASRVVMEIIKRLKTTR